MSHKSRDPEKHFIVQVRTRLRTAGTAIRWRTFISSTTIITATGCSRSKSGTARKNSRRSWFFSFNYLQRSCYYYCCLIVDLVSSSNYSLKQTILLTRFHNDRGGSHVSRSHRSTHLTVQLRTLSQNHWDRHQVAHVRIERGTYTYEIFPELIWDEPKELQYKLVFFVQLLAKELLLIFEFFDSSK